MLISDHINLLGDNPLVGENVEDWGPRFPDMSQAYDRTLMDLAAEVARRQGIILRQGVYVAVKGPSLETPAETRFLRLIGADAVGMSTVSQATVAAHCGLRILAIAVITNVNLPDCMGKTTLEEVVEASKKAGRSPPSGERGGRLPGLAPFACSAWILTARPRTTPSPTSCRSSACRRRSHPVPTIPPPDRKLYRTRTPVSSSDPTRSTPRPSPTRPPSPSSC